MLLADYMADLRKLIGTRPVIMCGANVLLVNSQDQILLHHRVDRDWWGLPGGAMELGESVEETALREVYEEVGLSCRDLKLFNVYSGAKFYHRYSNGDEIYNVTVTYICRDYTGSIRVDPEEGTEARFFSLDALPGNLASPIEGIVQEFRSRYPELKRQGLRRGST
jgi:8-oxo-dGTP pyrophosphatase MutT (NUDIX family)